MFRKGLADENGDSIALHWKFYFPFHNVKNTKPAKITGIRFLLLQLTKI